MTSSSAACVSAPKCKAQPIALSLSEDSEHRHNGEACDRELMAKIILASLYCRQRLCIQERRHQSCIDEERRGRWESRFEQDEQTSVVFVSSQDIRQEQK